MTRISQVSHAVRAALLVSLGASVFASPTVLAQENISPSDADAQDRTERIHVTGSRILREGAIAPAPVTVITGDELIESGAMNIGEVLSRLPAMANTYTLANSGRAIGTAGVSMLDLRGMGTSRTLVLVDGRRHVAGSQSSAAVDTNTIPSTWIERVEIITGGASAVYGADAVTGVVNFILKRDIEGFDASLTKGWADNHGYSNERFTLSYGTNFNQNRGNIAGSFEYAGQDSLNSMDHHYAGTSWAAIGQQFMPGGPRPADQIDNPDFPDRYTVPNADYFDISDTGAFFLGDPWDAQNWYVFNPDGSFRPNSLGGLVDPDYLICQDPCDYMNLRQYDELQPQFDRYSVNFKGNYQFTQNATGFLEAKYVRTEGQSIGQPFFHDIFSARPAFIEIDNYYVGNELRQAMQDAGTDSIYLSKFHNDIGRRLEDNTRETMRIVAAFEGNITPDWTYEASLVWGKTETERVNHANVILDNYYNALDAVDDGNGNPVCRNAEAIGCVPINVMGRLPLSQEAIDYVSTTTRGTADIEQVVATFNVQNSYLYALPAGYLAFAGGVEYRDESASSWEDPLAASGATFMNALGTVDGSFDVSEAYAEVSVPLLADLPGIRDLTLDAAMRYADYSTIGSATSWKLGLDWAITDELRTRFTVSEALRAPNISELFSAQSQSFFRVSDPCRESQLQNLTADVADQRRAACLALGVPAGFDSNYDATTLPGLVGGNPNLKPEESKSYTLGVVYQPSWLEGFSATVDYWEIDLTDTIAALSPQRILTECLDSPTVENQYCDRITREQTGDNAGRITNIQSFSLNIARSYNKGVDFEFGYDFDALQGRFRTSLLGTYLLQARSYPFQDSPSEYTDYSGVLGDADLQLRFTLDYLRDAWSIGLRTRYTNGVNLYDPTQLAQNPNPSNIMSYGAYAVTDAMFRYELDNGVRFTLGIDNLLDRDMPANTQGIGAGSAYYDNIGRFGYVRVAYSF